MKADINIIFSVPGPLDMSQSGPRGKKINSEQISPLITGHYLKDCTVFYFNAIFVTKTFIMQGGRNIQGVTKRMDP